MDLMDSKNINNRIKKRSIAIAIIVHLYLAVFTFGISLILLLLIGFLTATLLEKDISEARSSANTFNKNFSFRYFGQVFGSFQHVFYNAYSKGACDKMDHHNFDMVYRFGYKYL